MLTIFNKLKRLLKKDNCPKVSNAKRLALLMGWLMTPFLAAVSLHAQNSGNYRVDKTEPYELVAPSLTTLHTNLVFSKEDQMQTTGYSINTKGDSVVLVGDLITVDTLLKYIPKTDITDDYWAEKKETKSAYLDENPTLMKNLSIYCDSFVFNKSLWLPGVNVLIHARKINWSTGLILGTMPRPWRESKTADKSKNGADGGNIEVICESYNNRLQFRSYGGDATGVQFGPVSFTKYTTFSKYWLNSCNAYLKDGVRCYKEHTVQDNLKLIYLTYIGEGSEKCPKDKKRFLKPDENPLYYDESQDKVFDNDADTRLSWSKRPLGKGGKSGTVKVSCSVNSPDNYIRARAGIGGYYYAPAAQNSSDAVQLTCDVKNGILMGDIRLVQKEKYQGAHIQIGESWDALCNDHYLNGYVEKDFLIRDVTTREGSNAWKKFEDTFRGYAYSSRESPTETVQAWKNNYCPSEIYLRHKFTLEKNKIKDFQSLSPKDTAAVLTSLRTIANGIIQLVSACDDSVKNAPNQTARNYYSFKLMEARKMQAALDMAAQNVGTQRYLDEFNNPLGYRPVLSFTAINEFMKNNIDTDLRLYLEANAAMENINDRAKFLKDIPALTITLDKGINMGYTDLQKNEVTIDSLGTEGFKLEEEAQSLNNSLLALEKKLLKRAEKEAKSEKNWRMGAKVLAVGAACVATGLGGPAAGAIAYSMTDKLTNAGLNVDYDNNGGSNVEAVKKDVNIMPLLGGIKKLQLKPVQDQIARMEYRSKSDMFKSFAKWEVEGDEASFFDVKFPDGLKEYMDVKDKLETKLEKVKDRQKKGNDMASFAVKGGEEIYSTFTRTDILDNAINRVINGSYEYKEIGELIKYNARKYGEFGTALRAAIIEKGAITSRISELAEQRNQLRIIAKDPEAFYDPLLANNMASIETQALRRLKWMEYQLVNIYNYTTLTPYPGDSITNFRLLASRELAGITDINKKVERMRMAYDAHLQYMKFLMVSNATKGHNMDDKNGVKIIFNQTDSPEVLAALNDEQKYTFDLYNDLQSMVEPDKDNIRIVSLDLEEFELSRSLGDNEILNLAIELDDEGILRKGDKLYRFKDDGNAIETWNWTLNVPKSGSKSQAEKKANIPSVIYEDMLAALINNGGTKERGRSNLFTLKPAWSKMTISLVKKGLKSPIEIKRLKFKVTRDFETSASKFKICDLRVKAEETDVRLVVKKGANRSDTLSNSQYNIVAANTEFALEAYTLDTTREFARWETTPENLVKSAQGNVLKFNVKDLDVFARPVFQDKKPKVHMATGMPTGMPTSKVEAKMVHFYKSPDSNAKPVLSVPVAYFKNNLKVGDANTNGFYTVVYEYEEYFVDKKDLE